MIRSTDYNILSESAPHRSAIHSNEGISMNIDLNRDRPSDDLDGNIPVKLTKEELLDLSALCPLRSTFHIVAEWTLILTAILLCQRHFNFAVYLLTVAFIGARQHALL